MSGTVKAADAKNGKVVVLAISNGVVKGELAFPAAPAAACMAANVLEELGANVTRLENPDRKTLRAGLRAFAKKARNVPVALVYYSGFTMSWRGEDRVIPADARWKGTRSLVRSSIALREIRAALRKRKGPSVIMLDGGYERPPLSRLSGVRKTRVGKGLARARGQRGMALLLAAQPGKWRPASQEEAQRLVFAASEVLRNREEEGEKKPLVTLLQAIARKVAHGDEKALAKILNNRLGGNLPWPLEYKPQESGFFADQEELSFPEIFDRCLKMVQIRMLRVKARRACRHVLAMPAKRKGMLARYSKLLAEYPHAPCLGEVKKRQADIKEKRLWKRIAKSEKPDDFALYLNDFPKGAHADEARKRRDALVEAERKREEDAFTSVMAERDIEKQRGLLDIFLKKFPNGAHADQARKRIVVLISQIRELKAFQEAKATGRKASLETFITANPDSVYVDAARELIRQIEARKEREKSLWKEALAKNDLGLFRIYQQEFPDGVHKLEAKNKIESLEKEQRRKSAMRECRDIYGSSFIKIEGEDGEYFCVTNGEMGKRVIPLAAEKYKDWFYIKRKGRCSIWTYPEYLLGNSDHDGMEPEIKFSRDWIDSGSSMILHITSEEFWSEPDDVKFLAEGKSYRLNVDDGFLKPRKTGEHSVSDEVTKALAKWDKFTLLGSSARGGPLEMHFSAKGFMKQFYRMADNCGNGILTWVEDWAAVTKSSNGFQWTVKKKSKKIAKSKILSYCRSKGYYDCRIVVTMRNRCFAIYEAMSGGWDIAIAKKADAAQEQAKAKCESLRGGCYLSIVACSDGSNEYVNRNPPKPTLTFKFSKNYFNNVSLSFYSQTRRRAWPGNGNVWVLEDSEIHDYTLACQWGEKICWGAWERGNSSSYWGCGYNCRQSCSSCCYTCNGGEIGAKVLGN